MIDCGNSEIRELLPDLLHNSLSQADKQRVEAHLASCSDCREEYELLSQVFALGDTAAVDVRAIASAIPHYRKRLWMPAPQLVRVAAVIGIVALGALSFSIVNQTIGEGDAGRNEGPAIAAQTSDTTAPTATATSQSGVAAEVNSLDDQAVEELLANLEKLEATISLEPRSLSRSSGSSGSEQQ